MVRLWFHCVHDQFLRTVEFACYGAPFSCSCFKYFVDEFVNVGIVWDWGLVFYCKFVMRPGYNKSEAVVSILYSILALIMCVFFCILLLIVLPTFVFWMLRETSRISISFASVLPNKIRLFLGMSIISLYIFHFGLWSWCRQCSWVKRPSFNRIVAFFFFLVRTLI